MNEILKPFYFVKAICVYPMIISSTTTELLAIPNRMSALFEAMSIYLGRFNIISFLRINCLTLYRRKFLISNDFKLLLMYCIMCIDIIYEMPHCENNTEIKYQNLRDTIDTL